MGQNRRSLSGSGLPKGRHKHRPAAADQSPQKSPAQSSMRLELQVSCVTPGDRTLRLARRDWIVQVESSRDIRKMTVAHNGVDHEAAAHQVSP